MNREYTDTEKHTDSGMPDFQKGAVLCLFLTLISFAAVYWKVLSPALNAWLICIAAIVQVLVQFYYFLRAGRRDKERWDLVSLVFTFLIMSIFIGGTIWVMYTLNYRMM